MRVDFYVLGANRPDAIVIALAAKALGAGQRLMVVAGDAEQRAALSRGLWDARPERFLANGDEAEPHAHRQPILLSAGAEPLSGAANGAKLLCLADGEWREPEGFDRIFYLFDERTISEARAQWKRLGGIEGIERRYWKQVEGRWVEGP